MERAYHNDFEIFIKADLHNIAIFIPYYEDNIYRFTALLYQLYHLNKYVSGTTIYIYAVGDEKTISKIRGILRDLNVNLTIVLFSDQEYFTTKSAFSKTAILNEMLLRTYIDLPYICVLDYDVVFSPVTYHTIEKLIVGRMYSIIHPFTAMAYLQEADTNELVNSGDFVSSYRAVDAVVDCNNPGGCQIINTRDLENANGFNEACALGGEDIELWKRFKTLYGESQCYKLGDTAFHLYHPPSNWQDRKDYPKSVDEIVKISKFNNSSDILYYIDEHMLGVNKHNLYANVRTEEFI